MCKQDKEHAMSDPSTPLDPVRIGGHIHGGLRGDLSGGRTLSAAPPDRGWLDWEWGELIGRIRESLLEIAELWNKLQETGWTELINGSLGFFRQRLRA